MDADAVVHKLLDKCIIDRGDLKNITQNANPDQKNQILHLALKWKCTDKALMDACDIIIAVKGNPKMTALGEAMKEVLVASKCMCVVYSACQHVSMCTQYVGCMCACACTCVHTCVCVYMHASKLC